MGDKGFMGLNKRILGDSVTFMETLLEIKVHFPVDYSSSYGHQQQRVKNRRNPP